MAKKGKLSRRSFLTRVAGGVAITGAVGAGASAAVMLGRTDADSGNISDPGGNGRTGITDNDGGAYADQVGRGTGYTGYTDSDSGGCSDRAGHGRGNSGYTDSDNGGCTDPAGRGRGG